MAVFSIQLSDETFEKYAKGSPEDPRKGIEAQLERFKDVPVGERALIFDAESRKGLEGLFQRPIEDAAKLTEWVRRLQEIAVGGLSIPLTEAQVKRISTDARFFAVTPEKILKDRVGVALMQAIGV